MKIIINTCFGGFDLSDAAFEAFIQAGAKAITSDDLDEFGELHQGQDADVIADFHEGKMHYFLCDERRARADARLVAAVERLGAKANGFLAKLKVVEIPDSITFDIVDYDGKEHIAEKHQTWA